MCVCVCVCVGVWVGVCVCGWVMCVGVGGGCKGRRLYLTLHCHHQNDFCTKVGSYVHKSHFNASFIARGKVARHCPQTTTFGEKGEPKQGQSNPCHPSTSLGNALPPGQTGPRCVGVRTGL